MAAGPEHYLEAEKAQEAAVLLRWRWDETEDPNDLAASAWELANAAVHAQLAVAAGTAMSGESRNWQDRDAWSAVLGYGAGVEDC